MDLADVVKLECCEVDFTASDKNHALKKLAELIVKGNHFDPGSIENVYDSLKQREEMGSTGFGRGIAIPHCQLENIEDFIVSIVVSKKGVHFDALDKKKVKILVTIVGPKTDRKGHLQLLAQVSQILKEPGVIETLIKTTSKIGLYEEFLRNTIRGETAISVKGEDKLMLLIVKNEEIMQDITEVFIEFGVQESTIIDTQQMENLISKVPLFMGFFNFTGDKSLYSKIIMMRISKGYINAVVKALEDIFGDLDNYSDLGILVLDLFYSKGL